MKARIWLWFPVVAVSLILLGLERDVLPMINEVFFGDYHDALKNYYTVLYHVKWDESYFHFEGMNYPYGEHVLFTDNQPIISGLLRIINRNIFDITPYLPGIINVLILLSFPLCAWFFNLSLRKLGSKPWIAALVSTAIVFMVPQLNRIQRHFALSYSFIIPMFLYLGLLHLERPKWSRSGLIALLVIVVSFIHAYYLGFALLIAGGLLIIGFLKNRVYLKDYIQHFLIQAVLPFVFIQTVMWFTDSVPDRPEYPWSPFLGNFILRGFVINYDNPVSVWLSNTLHLPYVDWEAKAYLGIYTIIFVITGAAILLASLIKPLRRKIDLSFLDDKIQFLLLCSFLAIGVSFGYSLLSGNTALFQHIGPLRQFRAVGRFYWISFYALSLTSYAWLSYWVKLKMNYKRYALVVLVLLLLFFDAFHASKKGYHRIHSAPLLISGSPEQKVMQQLLTDADVIIPLPYFHIGSEDFALVAERPGHYKNTLSVSYAAGIPMTANALSRTSLKQTLNLLNYSYWPIVMPPWLTDLEKKQTVLLVDNEAQLTPHEEFILFCGGKDTLFSKADFQIISFDPQAYRNAYLKADSIAEYFITGTGEDYFFERYEKHSERAFSGEGSLMVGAEHPRIIDTISLQSVSADILKAGLWVYLYEPTKALEGLLFEFYRDGELVKRSDRKQFRKHIKALSGKWGFTEMEIPIPQKSDKLVLKLSQNRLHPTPTSLDDLRIYLTSSGNPDEGSQSYPKK